MRRLWWAVRLRGEWEVGWRRDGKGEIEKVVWFRYIPQSIVKSIQNAHTYPMISEKM